MEASMNCLRCKGDMEQGFLLDHSHNSNFAGKWVKGSPERSTLSDAAVKTPVHTKEIVTYRCTACGYLESYAH